MFNQVIMQFTYPIQGYAMILVIPYMRLTLFSIFKKPIGPNQDRDPEHGITI